MDSSLRNLETDLKNAKTVASEDDKFFEVMGVSFTNRTVINHCSGRVIYFHYSFKHCNRNIIDNLKTIHVQLEIEV